MMNKKIGAIVGVFAITVVIASLGCIESGGSVKDIAKMTPEGANSLIYSDLQTMRDDRDLRDIYKNMKKSELDELEDELGIDFDDVNYIAEAGDITIIGGKFDLKDLRDELDDMDFDKDEYKGVEFWIGEYDEAVAISGNKLILGDDKQVKSCIKVIKGDRTSMYDDEDVRDVINKLPSGIFTMVSTYPPYENALVMGYAMIKEDEDTMKIKGVVKFDDDEDAEDAKSDLKREMKEEDKMFDVDVTQSGKFLKFSAKFDIEDWEEVLLKRKLYGTPGFEAVFAIAGLLAAAHLLRRKI